MDLFWSGATPIFTIFLCRMTRMVKIVTRPKTMVNFIFFPLAGKMVKIIFFPPAGNSGPYGQKNGGGIVVIPPPRSLRRAYAVSCRETKNPNPLPTANRFGFLDFGTAEGIRTPDLLVRSQSLYPAELQPRTRCSEASVLTAKLYYHRTKGKASTIFLFWERICRGGRMEPSVPPPLTVRSRSGSPSCGRSGPPGRGSGGHSGRTGRSPRRAFPDGRSGPGPGRPPPGRGHSTC